MAGDLLTFFFRYLLSDCLRTLVWEYMPGSKACHSHMLIGGWVGSALGDPTVPVEDLYGIKGQHTWCLFLLLNVLSSLVVISTNRLHQKAINIERQHLIGPPLSEHWQYGAIFLSVINSTPYQSESTILCSYFGAQFLKSLPSHSK